MSKQDLIYLDFESLTNEEKQSFVGKNVSVRYKHYSHHSHLTETEGVLTKEGDDFCCGSGDHYTSEPIEIALIE